MRKLGPNKWSAPSSLRYFGVDALLVWGLEITDYVIIMSTERAMDQFLQPKFSFDVRMSLSAVAGKTGQVNGAQVKVYAYSRGLYAGVSTELGMFWQSGRVNEKFYGNDVSVPAILNGLVPQPAAAQSLYNSLTIGESIG